VAVTVVTIAATVVPVATTLIAVVPAVIAAVAAVIVIWTGALSTMSVAYCRRGDTTHRIVERDADRSAAEILAIQIFDSTVGVLPGEVLKDSTTRPLEQEQI
jgi:hypothetical protein